MTQLNRTLTGLVAINATGNDMANTLTGNDAANILDGGAGADTMNGGKGDDTYIVDDDGDTVTEVFNGGIDLVKSRFDFILGDNIENLMLIGALNGTGNALNNRITGDALNNTLDGQAGIDTMIGGDGNDTYFVDNVGDIVSETNGDLFLGGTDLVWTYINYTLATNVENLNVANPNGLTVIGNALNNTIFGNAGNDILNGAAGSDYLNGARGDDTLDGGAGADYLEGNQGSDTYIVDVTFTGSDSTFKATLQDTVEDNDSNNDGLDILKLRGNYTGTTAQTIYMDDYRVAYVEGIDISLTGSSKLNIAATAFGGGAFLVGNMAANRLLGSFGHDTLDGGLGNDTLAGYDGDDTYVLDVITDVIIDETSGNDTAKTAFSATLGAGNFANIENLTLTGTANLNATGDDGNNILTGNTAANTLDGGTGADTIDAGAGNDVLIGGLGSDTLTGGLGADRFDFNAINESSVGNADTIADFSHVQLDKIDLSTIDAKTGTVVDDAFMFIGNNVAFSNVAGQLMFDSATNSVYGDINGDSAADFQIILTGVTSLMVSDFVL
jgi:serralysin